MILNPLKQGIHKLLEPLVQDISTLETNGIQIPLFDHTVYETIVQVTGDNLGVHSLFSLWNSLVLCTVAAFAY